MVRIYQREDTYPEPPQTPLIAYFVRYPNPFARHVLSVDVLDRWIDVETGRLHTKRLILKRGIIPKWASKWLPSTNMSGGRGLDAWILEESVVDPPNWGYREGDGEVVLDEKGEGSSTGKTRLQRDYGIQPRLKFRQANMNHKKFMHVVESGELCAGPNDTTVHRTQAEIKSDFGGAWSNMIRSRIESYAIGRFETNSESSRRGMSLVMTRLRSRQPLPDTAEFYPPPPPQFGEAWPSPPIAKAPVEESDQSWFWTRWKRKLVG